MAPYVQTLDPADLTDAERVAVEVMTALFVAIEVVPHGCFDVLVMAAIEKGERRLREIP